MVRLAFTRANPWLAALSLAAYAALLEMLQLLIPGRTSQFIDFAFSGGGAACGIIVLASVRTRNRR
jgi:VanZ family protein